MTVQEAIETIKYASAFNRDDSPLTVALDMAIKEMEQKDNDCIIKHLTKECSYNETGCSGCKGIEKIKEALEKQGAKKPRIKKALGIITMECPCCKKKESCIGSGVLSKYCPECGQKLDWSGRK